LRHVLQRADVGGDVLTFRAIAARGGGDEFAGTYAPDARQVVTVVALDVATLTELVDEDVRDGISMAVREAMINAVLHGNAYDPAKRVNLTLEQNGRELIVTIGDEGKGLEPEEVPDPLAPENLMKQSGRGIFLIRAFMDEVRFRKLEPGTEITLIKRIPGPELGRQEAST